MFVFLVIILSLDRFSFGTTLNGFVPRYDCTFNIGSSAGIIHSKNIHAHCGSTLDPRADHDGDLKNIYNYAAWVYYKPFPVGDWSHMHVSNDPESIWFDNDSWFKVYHFCYDVGDTVIIESQTDGAAAYGYTIQAEREHKWVEVSHGTVETEQEGEYAPLIVEYTIKPGDSRVKCDIRLEIDQDDEPFLHKERYMIDVGEKRFYLSLKKTIFVIPMIVMMISAAVVIRYLRHRHKHRALIQRHADNAPE